MRLSGDATIFKVEVKFSQLRTKIIRLFIFLQYYFKLENIANRGQTKRVPLSLVQDFFS